MLPKDRDGFSKVLHAFREPAVSRVEAAARLRSVLGLGSEKTAARMLNSLLEFQFLRTEDDQGVVLSEESRQFVSSTDELSFSTLVLRCLSTRVEWESFIEDVADALRDGALGPAQILARLQSDYGYSREFDSRSYLRYLSDGLKLLVYAGLLSPKNGKFALTKDITPEVRRELTRVRTRVLLVLQKAFRRRVRDDTLRLLYHRALKVHLVGKRRTPRAELRAILNDADQIEAKEIRKKKAVRARPGEGTAWHLDGEPYPWQTHAFETWIRSRKGIAKVVTGAGKTRLALMVMERLHSEFADLKVSIVVPTIVLLHQWVDFLERELHVPSDQIGLRGGGYADSHTGGRPIVIYVINSAIRSGFIAKDTAGLGHHILIVDECHRAGAEKFRAVFECRYDWSLGLSATPERERDAAFDEVLVPRLGPIAAEVTYRDAREQGIIPDFDITNLAVSLTSDERERYEAITREIRDLVSELKSRYYRVIVDDDSLERSLRSIQQTHPDDKAIDLFFQKTMQRKRDIVYAAENRLRCVQSLLQRLGESDRTIIFHESIDRINELFERLDRNDIAVYHSGLPDSLLAIGMSLYRRGVLRNLLSVRALIEGVDIPSTNVGIIMASSSSTTQRVQSLGRILRNAPGKTHTQLYAVYVKDTTDERVFQKADWTRLVGLGSMTFRFWSPYGEAQIEPPRPRVRRGGVQPSQPADLVEGAEYAFRVEGAYLGLDSGGRIFVPGAKGARSYATTPFPILRERLVRFKPAGGRFLVTETGLILTKVRRSGKPTTLIAGFVSRLPEVERAALSRLTRVSFDTERMRSPSLVSGSQTRA